MDVVKTNYADKYIQFDKTTYYVLDKFKPSKTNYNLFIILQIMFYWRYTSFI